MFTILVLSSGRRERVGSVIDISPQHEMRHFHVRTLCADAGRSKIVERRALQAGSAVFSIRPEVDLLVVDPQTQTLIDIGKRDLEVARVIQGGCRPRQNVLFARRLRFIHFVDIEQRRRAGFQINDTRQALRHVMLASNPSLSEQ